MHEMSMCQGIVEAVVEEMGKLDPPPERLIRIRVVAGALHQIVPEYMTDAWTYLTRETPAEGSELEYQNVGCSSYAAPHGLKGGLYRHWSDGVHVVRGLQLIVTGDEVYVKLVGLVVCQVNLTL